VPAALALCRIRYFDQRPRRVLLRRREFFLTCSTRRASEVERSTGPIFPRAHASKPTFGYRGMRPAKRKGGPCEPTQASLARVFGEHGNPKVSLIYFAASTRRRS